MEKELNDQLKAELYSANLYLAMSSWCSSKDLNGTAQFFRKQSEEEYQHGIKIYDYLFEVGARAIVPAIDQPPSNYDSLEEIFKQTLDHEKHVTELINKLMELANQERDYATANLLNWFVAEQVEEEGMVNDILAQLRMVGTSGQALFLIDRELGKRE
jgi:ferritin